MYAFSSLASQQFSVSPLVNAYLTAQEDSDTARKYELTKKPYSWHICYFKKKKSIWLQNLRAWQGPGASLLQKTGDCPNRVNMLFPSFTVLTNIITVCSNSPSTCCSSNSADWAHKVWENSRSQGQEDFESHYHLHICLFHSSWDSLGANTC